MTFDIDDEIVNVKLKLSYNKVTDTEYAFNIDLTLNYTTEEENFEFTVNLNMNEYINKDIEINKPNSYIEPDELTDQDYQEIFTNLYENVKGTSLEEFLNLLLSNNNSLDIY